MRKLFTETLSALFDCANRISESESLTKQQQDDIQSIKSFGETLASCFDNTEREVNILKQRIKRLNRTNPSIELDDENETYTLIALIFARLRQSINLDELLGNFALEIHQLLHSDQVIVYQFTDQDIQSIQYEVVNDPRYSLLGQVLPSIYTDLQWLEKFQTSISQVINDVEIDEVDPVISASLLPLGIHSAIAIAIPSGKKLWGLLILHQYNISYDWRNWEIELLEKMGIQLAIAIHQMQLLVQSDDIRVERDQIIARLHYNQLHDSLTDLPNRDSFMESLDLAFTKLQTDPDCNFAVLFIDCDRFKSINDSFGIAIGNQLLQEISKRIAMYCDTNITIARIDSDEFVLLVENIGTENLEIERHLTELASQILESIGEPFLISDHQIITSVSIGIAISDLEYIFANEILRDANVAMHHSRNLGRGKQAIFTTSMNQGQRFVGN
jgi:diguanylate cyclase (GGDEF)-like protein